MLPPYSKKESFLCVMIYVIIPNHHKGASLMNGLTQDICFVYPFSLMLTPTV